MTSDVTKEVLDITIGGHCTVWILKSCRVLLSESSWLVANAGGDIITSWLLLVGL